VIMLLSFCSLAFLKGTGAGIKKAVPVCNAGHGLVEKRLALLLTPAT